MKPEIIRELSHLNIKYIEDAAMKNYTSFRVGGNADILILPSCKDELIKVLSVLNGKCEYTVIGAGTNLLFADSGYRGAIIRLAENFSSISVDGDTVTADAGVRLASLTNFALENGLCGLEFAGGIPGTVGGALTMNAGAYGGEIKDVLYSADVLFKDGTVKTLSCEECALSYRNSIFRHEELVVISAVFKLKKGTEEEVKECREKLAELNKRRRTSQPLEFPSAGSTFKRPAGYYAAALIEECGLKGFRVGGACVSTKHSGFVVNDMDATSREIYMLIKCVRKMVFEKSGVILEPEVIMIGDFDA